MAKIRRSHKLEFINRYNTGTKREFVGKAVDLIGEPQAWDFAVALLCERQLQYPSSFH